MYHHRVNWAVVVDFVSVVAVLCYRVVVLVIAVVVAIINVVFIVVVVYYSNLFTIIARSTSPYTHFSRNTNDPSHMT